MRVSEMSTSRGGRGTWQCLVWLGRVPPIPTQNACLDALTPSQKRQGKGRTHHKQAHTLLNSTHPSPNVGSATPPHQAPPLHRPAHQSLLPSWEVKKKGACSRMAWNSSAICRYVSIRPLQEAAERAGCSQAVQRTPPPALMTPPARKLLPLPWRGPTGHVCSSRQGSKAGQVVPARRRAPFRSPAHTPATIIVNTQPPPNTSQTG
jgi:hypothetical protein